MWYILDAAPGATLVAGLRPGVTRRQFEAALQHGGPAIQACFHQLPVRAGDVLFVPSGRLHAIGAGIVIAEIQQNSDTTYRVYDWDRKDAAGKPRALQVRESLASIDFQDFAPALTPLPVRCEDFVVEKLTVTGELAGRCDGKSFQILGGITGVVTIIAGNLPVTLAPGEFALLPATLGDYRLTAPPTGAALLRTYVP